jgi:O-antigen/teichoic acid export membrane protein
MLKSLYNSPALRVATALAFGGAAFTVGNLILARVLPAGAYGLVSLIIGLVSVAAPIAPLGIDLVIARRGLRLGLHLRRAALAASVLTGLVTTLVASLLYHLQPSLLACLFVATTTGGMSQSSAAHFQSEKRFAISIALFQSSNWALIAVGIISASVVASSAVVPSAGLAVSAVIAGVVGWILVSRKTEDPGVPARAAGLWSEAIALMSVTAASAVFLNLERLVVPTTVGVEELAIVGVLGALVGSPFRVVQAAVSYSVVPAMRDAASVEERRQLLRRESLVVAVAMGLGSLAIWVIAPRLAHLLLAGRYELTDQLMLATLVSGVLKVLSAFGTAVVNALAPEKGLQIMSIASWACIALATAVAFPAAQWGLVGVLYAISLGWLARCFVAAWVSLPHLRNPVAASAAH